MKKTILFILFILSFQNGIKGKSFVSIDNFNSKQCVTITTIDSNENRYKAKVKIHGFYDSQIKIDGTTYHQLSLDEPTSLYFVGEPSLPIISRLICLPKGEEFNVKIVGEKWSDDMSIGIVMPNQKPVLETEKEPPFEINDSIYNQDVYHTERVYIGNLQKWRGVHNRALNICPFKYMPREGKVSVLKEFEFEITFEGSEKSNLLESKDIRMFLNKFDISTDDGTQQKRDVAENYNYLIIAGNIPGVLECQALDDFRKWKACKGYKTKVVSTSAIGTTAAQIKQYISSEYPKGVEYVLFIGDSDMIPLYNYINSNYYTAKSDYWYGCMDGDTDIEADIFIGRFSTNNLQELTNMINKTMLYEKSSRSYGNTVLLVANQEGAPGNYQGCLETIRTTSYNEPVSFTTAYGADSNNGGNNATNAFVISEINVGKNIINYRGHGEYDQWQWWDYNGQSFYMSQINSLGDSTNDVYFCIACQNGNIHNQTCFMETFMRSPHGAAGIIAATEDTNTIANHTFNQYLFSKMLNDSCYNIGKLNVTAHIANIGSATGELYDYSIINAFSYLCGCDPSLEIVTGSMNTFNDYTLSLNGSNLVINNGNIGGYEVNIINEDGSLYSVINSTGSSCSFPTLSNNFYIVLNKHNYVPCVIYVNQTDSNIQNKVFNNTGIVNYYLKNTAISVGYDVTTSMAYGNVSVENGNNLTIKNSNGVHIKNGFECKLGGEIHIK